MSSVELSSRNELSQDYLNMKTDGEEEERKSDPLLHYDNVGQIRPVDETKKLPIEPMEVVPMIQLDNFDNYDSYDNSGQSYDEKSWSRVSQSNHSSNNYLNMDSNMDCLLSRSDMESSGQTNDHNIVGEMCLPPPYSHVV